MSKSHKNPCQMSLQSGPDFCNLQSGCKTKSLIKNENSPNPDCRLQTRESGLQSGKTYLYQTLDVNLRLYCRPPWCTPGGNKPPLVSHTSSSAPKVVKEIDFVHTPKIGTVLMLGAQRYVLIATEPYTRTTGQRSAVLQWQSHCPECDAVFVVKSGLKARAINRRCPVHHRGGVPVTQRRSGWRGARP